jgi:hypothetical protein
MDVFNDTVPTTAVMYLAMYDMGEDQIWQGWIGSNIFEGTTFGMGI